MPESLTSEPRAPHARSDSVDMRALRAYRLARLRAEMKRHDVGGLLLFDPVNIRYATDSRNMSLWTAHNATRYAFIATEGPVILFEFHGCQHLAEGIETIDEIRPAISFIYFTAGPRAEEQAGRWADEIADLMRQHGGGNLRLAADKIEPLGTFALAERGVSVLEGQAITEVARVVKGPEELLCMARAIEVCQLGMAAMHEQIVPGMTENQLWSLLHQVNIANDGEWIETRILASGPRTNPWMQECSGRVIEAGDLVSYDTDLIGPYGYCADLSRSFLCGDGPPNEEQRRVYRIAREQIETNIALLKPGLTFKEIPEIGFRLPDNCVANRYGVVMHGVGMADEYPALYYSQDYAKVGYDGVFEPGMVICVESYTGEENGREGVKLEEQVLITETGTQRLSDFRYEDEIFGREI